MTRKLPEKYKTCDWLWNYGSIGLTKEHIKRLNNAINILESVVHEYTDAKYLKEIKDKLLENTHEPEVEKTNIDDFVKKACDWMSNHLQNEYGGFSDFIKAFKNAMKGK